VKPTLSRKLLRSLPTLTEVVAAPPPVAAPQPAATSSAAGPASAEDALVERVLQRLEGTLDAQIRQAVAEALEVQMKDLAPRIRQRVDSAVRKALAGELKSESTSRRS
jgi:hypothetical protein